MESTVTTEASLILESAPNPQIYNSTIDRKDKVILFSVSKSSMNAFPENTLGTTYLII